MQPILPNSEFIGRIYGPDGNTPIKSSNIQCFIITRFTKTKVFARKLQMTEILKAVGNGYFNENNFGIVSIEKPLVMFGDEIPFLVYHTQNTEYIRHQNMILFRTNENVAIHTLSSESSIYARTPWH